MLVGCRTPAARIAKENRPSRKRIRKTHPYAATQKDDEDQAPAVRKTRPCILLIGKAAYTGSLTRELIEKSKIILQLFQAPSSPPGSILPARLPGTPTPLAALISRPGEARASK